MIKGLISDMDGVILDSEKLYVRFWCEAARLYGFPMEKRHALSIRSMARPFAIERLHGFFGTDFDYDKVRNKRVELMDAYVAENGIEPKPGAEKLLSFAKSRGLKTALATATPADRAEDYLSRVGLLQYFDEVVSARMVKNGKPEPDIYLLAAEKIGLPPESCIALEDSVNGVISAGRAGCKTVLVPDLDDPRDEVSPYLFAVADKIEDVIGIIEND